MIEKSVVRIESITYIRKPQLALQAMSFMVKAGECLVLLGANGTGKTTTLHLIAGLLLPDSGQIFVNGLNIHADRQTAKSYIGFLGDNPPLYPELTVKEYLSFVSNLRQIPNTNKREALERALEQLQLQTYQHHLIGLLSKGLRQRVGIAQAILHRPTVLLLDEPTQGLDKEQIDAFQMLLYEYKKNAAIILSTHYLNEVEGLYDKTLRFNRGGIPAYDFNHCPA